MCAGTILVLGILQLVVTGCYGHPHGVWPCPESAEIGTDFVLELPVELPSNLGIFQILDRATNFPEIVANCTAVNKMCDNAYPSVYQAENVQLASSSVTTLTLFNVQRYTHELTINFEFDPTNFYTRDNCDCCGYAWFSPALQCNLQVYEFSSEPYCNPPLIVMKDELYYIIYQCGIKNVYPNPVCVFSYPGGDPFDFVDEWYEDASKPHDDPEVFDKDCFSHAIPISSHLWEEELNIGMSFHVAPDVFDGKDRLMKTLPIDPWMNDPPTLRCDIPTIVEMDVVFTCVHISFYKNVTCSVLHEIGGESSPLDENYMTSDLPVCTQSDPTGCTNRFHFSVPINEFSTIGTHTFEVNVTASTTGGLTNSSIALTSIEITPPEIALVNCPLNETTGDSLLSKWGERVRCECSLTSPGYPKGSPFWYEENGVTLVGKHLSKVSRLVHIFDETDTSPTFVCKGTSPIASTDALNFTIQYAYGPNMVIPELVSPSPYNYCPGSNTNPDIEIHCLVPKTGVRPGEPNVIVTGLPGGPYQSVSVTELPDEFQYSFQIPRNVQGEHQAKCEATNILYEDFSVSNVTTFEIYEPPSSPPILTLPDGSALSSDTITLEEGEELHLTCTVDGGYPSVTEVTLTCQGHEMATPGKMTSLTMTMDREHHQGNCICQATHATGCYDLTTEVSLSVKARPKITGFSIQGQSDDVTLTAGTRTNLECTATGSPRPSVQFKMEDANQVLTPARETDGGLLEKTLSYTKLVGSCLDADVYMCVADNELGSVNKSIQVLVQCQPELRLPSEDGQLVIGDNGQNTSAMIYIMSFPLPTSTTLDRIVDDSTNEEVPADRYEVDVIPDTKRYFSTLTLDLYDLSPDDKADYVLTVSNDIGDPLKIYFKLAVSISHSSKVSQTAAVASGSVIGAVVLFALISMVVCCCLRHNRKADHNDTEPGNDSAPREQPAISHRDSPTSHTSSHNGFSPSPVSATEPYSFRINQPHL